ncbi:glycosyl hydrolase family 28-related protein [Gottfriedia acidiceleris]|uniref:glycosyl hydrolase family 28-related protein n=1 Tax=Gottfriedia acidiceleris TaxID=371036 RepID=UPI00101BE2EF|nr:glycosyl hydrolase family 28-related protein [Gottfriedia acidiceleris]
MVIKKLNNKYKKTGILLITVLGIIFILFSIIKIVLNNSRHIINVEDYGTKGDGVTDDTMAIQKALNDLNSKKNTLIFPKGTYTVTSRLYIHDLHRINIIGENATIENKANKINSIIYIKRCKNVAIKGFKFIGLTKTIKSIVPGDRGIQFHGGENIIISKNIFKNFGDGALQLGSDSSDDPSNTVHPKEIYVTENFFNNIVQTSTTPSGAENYHFTNNKINKLFGAIKFAQRKNNGTNLFISNNKLTSNGNNSIGFEIAGYSNITITNNDLNGFEKGVYFHQNENENANSYESKDLLVQNNSFKNCAVGIHIYNNTFSNGDQLIMKGISIINNKIVDSDFAIAFQGYKLQNIKIDKNKIYHSIKSDIYYDVNQDNNTGPTSFTITNNTFYTSKANFHIKINGENILPNKVLNNQTIPKE